MLKHAFWGTDLSQNRLVLALESRFKSSEALKIALARLVVTVSAHSRAAGASLSEHREHLAVSLAVSFG